MKFNCGPTRQEKIAALEQWHRWFAWHPVRIEGTHDCYWLQFIERKGDHWGQWWVWQYRVPANGPRPPSKSE